jgi:phosphatidylglycerol:prolipoprotein diacylglycerol transferase
MRVYTRNYETGKGGVRESTFWPRALMRVSLTRMDIHALFDGFAWLATALLTVLLRRTMPNAFPSSGRPATGYLVALVIGAALGAYGLGTLNVWLAGQGGVARSIEGALAGAILAVELYKRAKGIKGRTAALFVLPIAVGIGVGRIGCYLAGMDDFTYGIATDLPWGHDFGDGILRHPVQLYETLAMAVFAASYSIALLRHDEWVIYNGFALLVLFYAIERFGLEFLKPYPPVFAGLTVFQIVCALMIVYALAILRPKRLPDAQRV